MQLVNAEAAAGSPGRRGALGRLLRRDVLPVLVPERLAILRGPAGSRKVALTFDDGPDWMTERYLDLLDELGVRATFFLIGKQVAAQPQLTRAYLRRGHELLGHGYTHRRFPALSDAALSEELRQTAALLPPSIGGTQLVRPPKGSLDARSLLRLQREGFTPVMWSMDSLDYKLSDADAVLARLRREPPGGGEILLLHEGQSWTLEALPGLVQLLRARGLEPVTLSELLGR